MVSERSERRTRSGDRPNYRDNDDDHHSSDGEGSDEDFAGPAAKASQRKTKPAAHADSPPSPAEADGSQVGNSSDSDEEELAPRTGRRVKKTNPKLQKKGKTPVAKRPRAPKLPRVPLFLEEEMTDADELLDVIKNKPNSIAMAVNRWWKHYLDPRSTVSAVHELVKLIVEVSGHKDQAARLAPSLFDEDGDEDIDNTISDLCDKCARSGVLEKIDHIGTKSLAGKKLRANLEEFFFKFANSAPRTELVDLQDKHVSTWIVALSNCPLQEIRSAATLAGLQIFVGLSTVASEVCNEIANKSRLKQAEMLSKGTNKDKEGRLAEELKELFDTKMSLTSQISALFASVFVHRYVDICPDIRVRCATCMGSAIRAYSEELAENTYLKYLSWALNDKHKDVRCAALDELFEIYESEDQGLELKLEMLTDRFQNRFVEMRTDCDNQVAVKGIKLCTMLFKNGVLKPDDEGWTDLYESLNCEEDEVRNAAAGFIEEFYIKKQLQELYESACESTEDSIDEKEFKLKGMVELIHRVLGDEDSQDFTPLIQSFTTVQEDWGMQDWGLMCKLLLQEDDDEALDGDQKETLLCILTASLACCLESDDKPKKNQRYKDTKSCATAAIMSHLPEMLTTLGTEEPKMTLLMSLVSQLDLNAVNNSHKKDMDKIVSEVCDAVVKGQNSSLLAAASSALERLSSGEYPLKRMVEPAVVMLIEKLFIKLEEAKNSFVKSGKLTLMQILWIQRLSSVNNCVDICSPEAQPQAWDAAMEMLGLSMANSDVERLPSDAACLLCNFCVQSVSWRVQEALDAPVSGSTKVGELDTAVKNRDEALEMFRKICNDEDQQWAVRLQAMAGVSDLMQLFGDGLKDFLVNDGAEEEEVLMGDLIVSKSMVVCEDLFQDLAVLPKLPKSETWKETAQLNLGGYAEDEQDKSNLGQMIAIANVKPLFFCLDDKDDSTSTPSLVASIVMQTKYNQYQRRSIVDLFRKKLANTVKVQTETLYWLQAHQMSYMRTAQAVQDNPRLDVEQLSLSMIESINLLEDRGGTLYRDYLINAVAWVLEDLRNIGFLNVVSPLVSRVDEDTARQILATLDEYTHEADLEARQEEQLGNFRAKLQDVADADLASLSSVGSAVKRKGKVKAKIDFSDGDSDAQSTGMRTPVKASHHKPSKPKSSSKRKKMITSDDEDEEGFVIVSKARKTGNSSQSSFYNSDSEESVVF